VPRARDYARGAINQALHPLGFKLVRQDQPWWARDSGREPGTVDFPAEWNDTIDRTRPYTMVGEERMGGLIGAVEYVSRAAVPGAFVECGVWRGGSVMAAALTFLRVGDRRELWLYDTFEGMTRPDERDVDYNGVPALDGWADGQTYRPLGSETSLEAVREAVSSTGYDMRLVTMVRGKVEDTVPDDAPPSIAILRLDTDWYESTRHELEHLYPRLSPGGVLIVDDYGHYAGARQAVDEYFADAPVYLARLDHTGRIAIKRS
jgi:O-methyltransferase